MKKDTQAPTDQEVQKAPGPVECFGNEKFFYFLKETIPVIHPKAKLL
jgi:hypothetical protein